MLLYACSIKYRKQETFRKSLKLFFSATCVVSACNDDRGRDLQNVWIMRIYALSEFLDMPRGRRKR